MPLPRFIGIGAQKAGTSWLHANLKSHPEVWFPPMLKEVHFFDRVHRGPAGFSKALEKRFGKRRKKLKKSKRVVASRAERMAHIDRLLEPRWESPDDWYRNLFADVPHGVVPGEITPSYSAMGETGISHMKRLLPEVRLIYLVRDPLSRYMSQLRMMTHRARLGVDGQRELVTHAGFLGRGDYQSCIPQWDAAFGDQVLYLPFGWLKTEPDRMIRAVERHIGVSRWDNYPTLDQPVFKGRDLALDEVATAALVNAAKPQYEFLKQRFGEQFLSDTK